MQRRLEIARGLMHHPKVLFLDEPTLGLDAQTRRYIWKYVEEMNADGRSDHRPHDPLYGRGGLPLCDRVAIVDNGRIVALDTPKNLKDLIGADTITLEVESGGDALCCNL